MAPLPVITDTYRCAFKWSDSDLGSNAINVMHFRKSSTNPANVATIIASHVTANMWNAQTSHSVISEIKITPLDGSSVTYPYATDLTAKWAGGQSNQEKVLQGCNVIKLVTGTRGRSHRGRVYLPWIAEAATVQGQMIGATKTAVQTAWIAFLAAMGADTCKLVVASYKLQTADDVLAVACETYIATQRRRLVRTSAT